MITVILLLLFLSWNSRQKAKNIEDNVNGVNEIDKRMRMLDEKHTSNIMSVIFAAVALVIMLIMIFKK